MLAVTRLAAKHSAEADTSARRVDVAAMPLLRLPEHVAALLGAGLKLAPADAPFDNAEP